MRFKLTPRRIVAVGVLVVIPAAGIGSRYIDNHQALFTTGADVPDATIAGNPEAAVEYCRRLLLDYRNAGWNFRAVPMQRWFLPDRRFAENPDFRGNRVTSFCVPNPDRSPYNAEVAFYTDIYVRRNVSRYVGDVTRSRPTGFYIVAYRNGEVVQVAPQDVRLIPTEEPGARAMVFPNTALYDPNGDLLPFVEQAAPPDPPIPSFLKKAKAAKSPCPLPCTGDPKSHSHK